MKRNILTLGLAALIGCAAFTAPEASAKQQRVLADGSVPMVKGFDKNEAMNKMRARRGTEQMGRIKGVRSGLTDMTKLHSADRPGYSTTRSMKNPRGHFVGNVGSFASMETFGQAFFGSIDAKTGEVTNLFQSAALINGNDYDVQGGFIRDNIFYTPLVGGDYGDEVYWNRLDLENMTMLPSIEFGAGTTAAYAYAMTYNEAEDYVYCLAIDFLTGADNMLSVFDCKDKFRLVAQTSLNNTSFVGGIAYNPVDQMVYAFDDSGRIFIVEAGKSTMLQQGQFTNAVCPIDGYSASQICYSPLDECFAMILRDPIKEEIRLGYFSSDEAEDGSYDAWEVVDGVLLGATGRYQTPFFSSLMCTDPYAENDAPALPDAPVFNYVDAALSGSIEITIPTDYYSGISMPATEKVATLVTIDGEEALKGDFAPGSKQTIQKELTQGEHIVAVTCTTNRVDSPTRTVKKWIGNDNPLPVTHVSLGDENLLTWNAPGAVGAHNGFVDTKALTYDVYFAQKKQNDEPIVGTSYTITPPKDLDYVNIRVVANANGLSSESADIHKVIGGALKLPVVLEPTVEESNLFEVIDATPDGNTFQYNTDNVPMFRCFIGYYDAGNDWLFLPVMNFPDTSHLYNFAFTFINAQYEGNENLDIYLTKKITTDTSDMVNIFSERGLDYPSAHPYSLNFGVPEAGDWYIAFRCTSPGATGGGVGLYEFAVNSLTGVSSDVPGDITDIKFTPAAGGELKTTIAITAPTKNIVGADLDPNADITYTVKTGKYTATGVAKPGQVATIEIEVEKSGFNQFEVTPSNANGTGLVRNYRQFVGVDRPLMPVNVKGVPGPDNQSYTLTWERPSDRGENGGYIDIDNLTYNIYNVTGTAYHMLGSTKDLTFTVKGLPEQQEIYNLGPIASNEIGESRNSTMISDILGKPYELPMVEAFGNNAFSYEPFFINLTGEFSYGAAQPIVSVLSTTYKHNCLEDCDDGAILFYTTAGRRSKGEIVFPKFTTKSIGEATISVRIIDFAECPDVEIWARCDGSNDLQKIGDLPLEKPVNGKWVDATVAIPQAYLDKNWVQMTMRFNFTGSRDEYAFIDSYTISQNIDIDMGVKSIAGSNTGHVGETYTYTTTIVNGGKEMIRQNAGRIYTRLRDKDGNTILYQENANPRIFALGEIQYPYTITFQENYADLSPLTLEVTTDLEGDEVAWNNTRSLKIEVTESEAPVVHDLAGKWNDDFTEVNLTWSEPDMSIKGYDGFELRQSGENGDMLGQFRNVDMDKAIPFCFNGVRWVDDAKPQAWHVIDVEDIYPFKGDARMGAHGGSKYIMARTPEFNEETMDGITQAADWLISPEVKPGSSISFWYGTADSSYTEYIELWVSSTDDTLGDQINKVSEETSVGATCGSFRYVRTFSKSGDEAWEFVQQQLPADAKYFALVYRSIDGFAVMLDDITFDQVADAKSELDHYSVWTLSDDNWKTWNCVADNLLTPGYTVKDADKSKTNTYYVITYVKSADSFVGGPRSNAARIFGQSVEGIDGDAKNVAGGKGLINFFGLNGEVAKIYSADGRLVNEATIAGSHDSVNADPGVYVITIGKSTYKIIVK